MQNMSISRRTAMVAALAVALSGPVVLAGCSSGVTGTWYCNKGGDWAEIKLTLSGNGRFAIKSTIWGNHSGTWKEENGIVTCTSSSGKVFTFFDKGDTLVYSGGTVFAR